MFILLLLLWFVFNGRFTIELLVFGIVISLAIYLFCVKFLGLSPKKEFRFIKKIGRAILYFFQLLFDIFIANCQVIYFIFNAKLEVEPVLIRFHSKLKSESLRVLLANSITLTPGTFTVKLKDNEYIVHCLDSELAFGEDESGFEQRLLKMEDKDD